MVCVHKSSSKSVATLNWLTKTKPGHQQRLICWFSGRVQGVLIHQGEIYEKQGTVGDGAAGLAQRGLRVWVERLSAQQLWVYDPRPRDPHCAGQLCPGTGLTTNGEMARGLITTLKVVLNQCSSFSLRSVNGLVKVQCWNAFRKKCFQRHS